MIQAGGTFFAILLKTRKASAGETGLDHVQTELLNQALAFRNAGRLDDLFRICRQLVKEEPACADAWYLLGAAERNRGDARQAVLHLSRAVDLDPRNPNYVNLLGVALMEAGQYPQAQVVLAQALQHHPQVADLHCNLGRALMLQKHFDQALVCFQKALAIDPAHFVSMANMAVTHQSCGRLHQAIDCYRRVLRFEDRQPKWWANLGTAYLSTAQYTEAVACFQRALAVEPHHPIASKGLGVAHCALGEYTAAADVLSNYLALCPNDTEATAHLAIVHQHTADWTRFEGLLPRLARQTEVALALQQVPAEQPLFNISRTADLSLNLAVARAWSRSIAQRVRHSVRPFVHHPGRRSSDRRITIGYLSADFRNHAVAHQAAALFELHDREKFRICGFSVGPEDNDEYRRRITGACDLFMDLGGLDDGDAAQTIYDQRVDLLIDLMGHTQRNRLGICALRPVPIQIGYLGFLASSGADFIDYLIGDSIVTPPEHAPCYSEKLIRLPFCYQIISPIPPASRTCMREQFHLPEKGVVFCCFNQSYKIDPQVFACWMGILKAVPSAVLWLYRSNDVAVDRLRAAAAWHGVSPDRLVFATKMPLNQHLERLKLADLALDTVAYNGGATTANALTAGVPVIATLGRHFVSRMSASHLVNLGLGALVASDLEAYGHLAIDLARSPQRLQSVRRDLKSALATSALLDTPRFVRHLEQAYLKVWWRYCEGLPPEHLDIIVHPDTYSTQKIECIPFSRGRQACVNV
jgi:predicted O-linked N-acetylglucosamine transferase (SPINDLY family)